MNKGHVLQYHSREIRSLLTKNLIAAFFTTAALFGAMTWRDTAEQNLAALLQSLSQAQEQLQRAQRLLENSREHYDRYRQLQQGGFAAPPQPILWTEQLLEAFRQLPLTTFRFTIHPANRLTLPPSVRYLYRSDDNPLPLPVGFQAATFALSELHEEEWLRFVAHLEASAPEHLRLEHCQVTRSAAIGLEVECEARWWFYPPLEQ